MITLERVGTLKYPARRSWDGLVVMPVQIESKIYGSHLYFSITI